MIRLLSLLWFILLSISASAQGPIDGYMKRPGEIDFALSYGYEHYDRYYLGNIERTNFDRTYQSLGLFMAYGFEENLGLVATLPYMWTDSLNRGFQDGQFFLKYRPLRKETTKGRLDGIIAGGVTTALSRYPISPESDNPIGERPLIFEARALVQHNFNNGFFVMAKTGLSFKVRPNTQTAIPNLLRFGYATNKFYTDIWIEGVFALGAEANDVPLGQEGSTFTKFGGVFYVPIGQYLGVAVNAAYTFWGRNIGISPRFGGSLIIKVPYKE